MKRWMVLGCLFLIGLPLYAESQPATEHMEIKLSSRYQLFRGGSLACTEQFFDGYIYLRADFANGYMTAAAFGTWKSGMVGFSDASQQFPLTLDERRGIELYRDSSGRLWLKKLTLSSRLFSWVLSNLGGNLELCSLEGLPLPVEGAPTFEFELSGIEEGILLSYSSQEARFSGLGADRGTYAIRGFYLVQTIPK